MTKPIVSIATILLAVVIIAGVHYSVVGDSVQRDNGKLFGFTVIRTRVVTEDSQGLVKNTVLLGTEDRLVSGRTLHVYKEIGRLESVNISRPELLKTRPGLLIVNVMVGSPVAEADLRPGTVLLGDVPPRNTGELFMSSLGGRLYHLESRLILSPVSAHPGVAVLPGAAPGGTFGTRKWCPTGCYPCASTPNQWMTCYLYTCGDCAGYPCCETGIDF